MTQRAGAATVSSDQKQAALQAQTDKSLYDLGVISGLPYSASKGKADELQQRNEIEAQRLTLNSQTIASEMAVQQAKVDQARAILALRQRESAALNVRAGINGVLVDLPHQVGEHVDIGATLAKVVQPDQLKASLKIPETQARDIQIGQACEIDTHNGVIPGKVMRIDPAVQNGTVTVDVELEGALPQGARPDLSIDGTIDLDHLQNVLTISRPTVGNENSILSLFRVDPGGRTATRVSVQVGRASVNSLQILSGLNPGDTLILSVMAMAILVLLIASVNVASLPMVRSAGRMREVSLRAALGASSGRIFSQLLLEGVLLGLCGGIAGLLLAPSALRVLIGRLADKDGQTAFSSAIDARILLFNFAVAVLVSLCFSLLPALQMRRPNLTSTLRESAGTGAGGLLKLRRIAMLTMVPMARVGSMRCIAARTLLSA